VAKVLRSRKKELKTRGARERGLTGSTTERKSRFFEKEEVGLRKEGEGIQRKKSNRGQKSLGGKRQTPKGLEARRKKTLEGL